MPTVARPTFCLLIGTRPEAVKLAPVVRAFKKIGIDPLVIATGQHEELVNPILSELQILVTERLATMDPGQELGSLAGRVAIQLQKILPRLRPDAMIVEGDTTSVAIAALTCHYNRVPVIHVEAGLRTGNELNPFPEEVNRKVVSCIARLHFAPTETAKLNLLREGIAPDRIHVVGNTVVDQLYFARDELLPRSRRDTGIQAIRATGRRIILVTGHRRESIGADLVAICRGVRKVAEKYVGEAEVLWPVHLNPAVGKAVHRLLDAVPNVRLLDPLSYLRFLDVLTHATLVITDSGGVQEEAAVLGVPSLVVRHASERMEAVQAGVSLLVGPDEQGIFESAQRLLDDPGYYASMARPTTVFGDGRAAERIVKVLLETFA